MKRRFRTAFILGAGLGTRLRPLTQKCPKPLLEVGGRPLITYAMDHLIGAGVDRLIVNIHPHPELYYKNFPDQRWRGVPIFFRHEPVLLDTGGGLKNIEDLLFEDEAIFCYNGDVISNLPLEKLREEHEKHRPEATLALRSQGPLLNVNLNDSGEICDLRNQFGIKGARRLQFTGIYAIETSFLNYLRKGESTSIVMAFLKRIADQPGSIRGVIIDEGEWREIGSIEAYHEMKKSLKEKGFY